MRFQHKSVLNDCHQPTGEFFDLMSSNSFLPLITRPTRVTANSAKLIDNIFTNHFDKFLQSSEGILVTDITDHYPVFHINRQITTMDSEIYIERRLYNQRNKQAFLGAIQEIDWGEIYSTPGTQSCFDIFHGKLVRLLNKCFPKVRMKMKYNNRNHGCLMPYGIQSNGKISCITHLERLTLCTMRLLINHTNKYSKGLWWLLRNNITMSC